MTMTDPNPQAPQHTQDPYFSVWVPIDAEEIQKSENGETPLLAKIGGIATDEMRDIHGEIIVQDGIDWGPFLERGYFNDDHKKGDANVLGYPTAVKRDGSRTLVEGYLYLEKPRAREIYENARIMQKAGGKRSLGYSVEGRILKRDERDPKRALRSVVLNVALTSQPVNPRTKLELLKSLSIAYGVDEMVKACGGDGLEKGGEVGYQTPASGGGSLAPVVPQSLAGGVSSATYGPSNDFEKMVGAIRRSFPQMDVKDAINLLRSLGR